MSYTPVQEVRLLVGDLSNDFQILPDESYDYFLEKRNGNVNRAAIDAARCILFELTKIPTRERTGQIEVWNEWANAYRRALELFIKNPDLSLSTIVPYAGGISKSDMKSNDMDNDNVRPGVYKGISTGEHVYNKDTDSDDDTGIFYR